ncbi:mitochondrial outer membrane protein porin of 36 kDa-like [Malania oleifera]|uniref:mitochondrial outer membrane protein porin of 36 kDa-like n=1 Tax=Malania oleifera TaxID=397392 RepID=UPI0025ADE408|nr:mitochondrial outer membrane protein porin of 36 kDa-like [Malania oleifera]XP_057951334.1 mitochondrial outer membrane protein porin of 36 kDa-like [Malania oleifera]
MSNHPGFYFDIGKKARDLLYKGHIEHPPSQYHGQYLDWSFGVSCEDIAPRLKTVFRFVLPDANKVELQYLHDCGGIAAGVGLSFKPTLSFSTVIGGSLLSVGTELGFNTASRMFTRCNLGLNFNTDFLIASLNLNDMGDTVRASCYHTLNPLTNTAIAAELAHSFSGHSSYVTIGTQHLLFPTTLVKARVSTYGRIGAIIQHELLPNFFITMAAEVETSATKRGAKAGLSVAFRP